MKNTLKSYRNHTPKQTPTINFFILILIRMFKIILPCKIKDFLKIEW